MLKLVRVVKYKKNTFYSLKITLLSYKLILTLELLIEHVFREVT